MLFGLLHCVTASSSFIQEDTVSNVSDSIETLKGLMEDCTSIMADLKTPNPPTEIPKILITPSVLEVETSKESSSTLDENLDIFQKPVISDKHLLMVKHDEKTPQIGRKRDCESSDYFFKVLKPEVKNFDEDFRNIEQDYRIVRIRRKSTLEPSEKEKRYINNHIGYSNLTPGMSGLSIERKKVNNKDEET